MSKSINIKVNIILRMVHKKCRNSIYPFSKINRLHVTDEMVPWSVPWTDYNPPEYNSPVLINKPWADPDIGNNFKPKWNVLDGNVNRKSYDRAYKIRNGYPLNPEGRTGLKGRGVLGRWGPNHAADPIVTRWKHENGTLQLNPNTNLPILQVCIIQRKDTNEWAFPGGMVDPGESTSLTLKREFMEEALNSFETHSELLKIESILNTFFASGKEVYKGYIDNARNTDNAWIETIAVNFHDDTGKVVEKMNLKAGDDAKNVVWSDIQSQHILHESHLALLKKIVQLKNANW